MRKVRIVDWSNREFIEKTIASSLCYADACRELRVTCTSGNYRTLKKYIRKYEISVKHFIPGYERAAATSKGKLYSNDEIFVENSTYHRQHLKSRIKEEKLIPYKCVNCGNDGTWMGVSLSLQLEHKNGVNNDDRIDNLCFMCPNCHSQTGTYAGRNKKHNPLV